MAVDILPGRLVAEGKLVRGDADDAAVILVQVTEAMVEAAVLVVVDVGEPGSAEGYRARELA